MSTSLGLTPDIVAYLAAANSPEHRVLARCRAETNALGGVSSMQISAEQGAFMQWLARLIGAKRYVEVGVFTGYSSTALALAMRERHGEQAYILACDVSEQWTSKARAYWQGAGVESTIDLKLGPALASLDAALARGEAGGFDLAFIDADKEPSADYYERCLKLLRPGGVLMIDNMLWDGAVADPKKQDIETKALRAMAQQAKADARVNSTLVAIGDGILMCLKK